MHNKGRGILNNKEASMKHVVGLTKEFVNVSHITILKNFLLGGEGNLELWEQCIQCLQRLIRRGIS